LSWNQCGEATCEVAGYTQANAKIAFACRLEQAALRRTSRLWRVRALRRVHSDSRSCAHAARAATTRLTLLAACPDPATNQLPSAEAPYGSWCLAVRSNSLSRNKGSRPVPERQSKGGRRACQEKSITDSTIILSGDDKAKITQQGSTSNCVVR